VTLPGFSAHGEGTVGSPPEPGRLRLTVELSEFADEDEVAEWLAGLHEALSDLHIAKGGSGLTIEDFGVYARKMTGVTA